MKARILFLLLALAALGTAGCGDSAGSGNTADAQDTTSNDSEGADTSPPEDAAEDSADQPDANMPDVPVGCESDDECTTSTPCAVSTCVDGTCQESPAEDGAECDDGVACTAGLCSSGTCTSGALENDWCQIDGTCYANGAPNPENGCEECAAATATDAWTVDDSNACDDGIACTHDACVSGVCTPTADDALCDDGNPCTIDSCDAASGCQGEELDSGESCGTGASDSAFCWTGAKCTRVTLKGEYGNKRVHHLRFSPDGTKLAVAANGSLSVWDVPTMSETILMGGNWRGVAWSPDGQWLISANIGANTSAGAVGTITLVDPDTPNTSTALSTVGLPTDYLADGSFVSVLQSYADIEVPRILDPSGDALLAQSLNSSNSNSFRPAVASGSGEYFITSEYGKALKVLDVRDFSTVASLATQHSARFTPDMEQVVYYNETTERFETLDFGSSAVTTLPAALVDGTPFTLGLRGGFSVFPDGEHIIAYDDSTLDGDTRLALVRLSDGATIHLATFSVGGESASLPRQSTVVDSTGIYTALPFTNDALKGFRIYQHDDLWHPWACSADSECGATEFCNLATHTCYTSMCKDGQDNDGDNYIDSADPDCASGQLEIADDSP